MIKKNIIAKQTANTEDIFNDFYDSENGTGNVLSGFTLYTSLESAQEDLKKMKRKKQALLVCIEYLKLTLKPNHHKNNKN